MDALFGYGSIISSPSRVSSGGPPFACRATLSGWARGWNFRSDTGFTALGLAAEPLASVGGVVFAAGDLAAFDEREVGYDRVRVARDELELHLELRLGDAGEGDGGDDAAAELLALHALLQCPSTRFWTYVPEAPSEAAEDFPICQTYVDVVISGCLAVGGEEMASELISTTRGWSSFFLNDAPMSRRPWLHRGPHYRTVDKLLALHESITRFSERRHPEEFASQFLTSTRGMWNVPQRNPLFVGREADVETIASILRSDGSGSGAGQAKLPNGGGGGGGSGMQGISVCPLVGLGGVGKSQIAAEYCHRQYQAGSTSYGLICWLSAETADSIAADLRRLANDFGIEVTDKQPDEIAEEIKARLYKTRCPWLLVFDNVEDHAMIARFLPRGGHCGHVLLTARRSSELWHNSATVRLGCFSPAESAAFLRQAAMQDELADADADADAGSVGELAELLGNLPLALAVAAAYMRRCDVGFASYVAKFRHRTQPLLGSASQDYPMSVAGSLSLSLERLAIEAQSARVTMDAIGFLAPDDISKDMVELIVESTAAIPLDDDDEDEKEEEEEEEEEEKREPAAAEPEDPAAAALKQPRATGGEGPSGGAWDHSTLAATALQALGATLVLGAAAQTLVWRNRRRAFWATGAAAACFAGSQLLSATGAQAGGPAAGAAPGADQPSAASKPTAPAKSPRSLPRSPSLGLRISPRASPGIHSRTLEDEADVIWDLMKQYSLLTVRGGVGSVHRLLQQVLRQNLKPRQARRSVSVCLRSVQRLWGFQSQDRSTWASAGQLLEHIKQLSNYVVGEKSGYCCSDADARTTALLLVDGGEYVNLALSRFDEARGMLERALRLLGGNVSSGELSADASVASCMFVLGKVMRYQGELADSEEYLTRSLESRRAILGGEQHPEVAASLHELGVLYLKKHNLPLAESHLRRSLAIKRRLARGARSRDQANTLHQLAAVATHSKPPRLDEAELLYRQALSADSANRGLTLKALGGIAMRRGQLDQADALFREALGLQIETYGSDLHLNVATVHHQLCVVALSQGRLEDASTHVLAALRIRKHIHQISEHPTVARELTQLGSIERAKGDAAAAHAAYDESKQMLERLLEQGEHEVESRRELVQAAYGLRQIARDQGDTDAAQSWTRYALEIKDGSKQDPEPEEVPEPLTALQAGVLQHRKELRGLLITAAKKKKGQRRDPLGTNSDLTRASTGPAVQQMRACVSTAEQNEEVDSELCAAAVQFCDVWESEAELVQLKGLFEACDALRSALRISGANVED